jgi:hypothetical protein
MEHCDGTLYLQGIGSGESKDLSALAGVSFASDETGRPGETTTYGVAGWSRDGRYVMVNAKYDVWTLPVSGTGRAIDLKGGVGALSSSSLYPLSSSSILAGTISIRGSSKL